MYRKMLDFDQKNYFNNLFYNEYIFFVDGTFQ